MLSEKSASRPLLVTDRGMASSPAVASLLSCIRDAGMDPLMFGDVSPNPTDVDISRGAEAFRAHNADAVVAMGGGSGLDGGKAIAMVAKTGIPLNDFEWTKPPVDVAAGDIPPVVAIPTTSGTGAEMDSASMYTDTAAQVKWCVAHPQVSITVVADPELTLSLPPHLTAWTGMDALTHALEAYCVDTYHPQCDGIALEALRMIHEWLPIAYADGTNLEARSHMLAASSMAAVAFQKGLGSVHGISEPIGALHNTQHGLTNAVILPHVLRVNRPAIERKCEIVAHALSLPPAPAEYMSTAADADPNAGSIGFYRVCHWIDSMCRRLEIPRDLVTVGVVDGDTTAAQCAAKAVANPTGHTNPIPYTVEQYEAVFRRALAGRRDNYETF